MFKQSGEFAKTTAKSSANACISTSPPEMLAYITFYVYVCAGGKQDHGQRAALSDVPQELNPCVYAVPKDDPLPTVRMEFLDGVNDELWQAHSTGGHPQEQVTEAGKRREEIP